MSLLSRVGLRRHAILPVIALVGLTAACTASAGGGPLGDGQPNTSEPSFVPPTPPDPAATVVAPGSGSLPTTFICDGIALSIDAFDDIGLLADNPLPAGAFDPLEQFLATGEGDFWPQDGYWVIDTNEDHYLLAHHDPNGTMTLLGTQRSPNNDGWVASTIQSGRPCELRSELPEGFGIVEWRVDPDRDSSADASHVDLLAIGRACSSGQPMGDRLMPPQVTEVDDVVFVALMARLPEGDQNCPGNPEEPVRIELDGPLGEREVRDALRSGQTLADYVPVSP